MKLQEYFKNHLVKFEDSKVIIFVNKKFQRILFWKKFSDATLEESLNYKCHFVDYYARFVGYKIQLLNKNTKHITDLKSNYTRCFNCYDIIESEECRNHNDDLYCEECFEELFYACTECGEIIWQEDARVVNDEILCDECFEKNYFHCAGCGNDFPVEESNEAPNGDNYCGDCFNETCDSCQECGEIVWRDDIIYNEEDDEYLCSECDSNRTRILNSHDYKPSPVFLKKHNENNPLFIGFELEIECGRDRDENDEAEDLKSKMKVLNIEEYFYLKTDGSLSNGFEIVSHPFSQLFYKNLKMKSLLEYLSKQGYTSHDNGNCGLHFHIDRKYFTISEINRLKIFFSLNKKKIFKLSRREVEENINRWARIEDLLPAEIFGYGVHSSDSRYVAVNVTSKTVEIRIFRGTLNNKTFLNSLKLIYAIIDFIKQTSSANLFNGKSWSEFMKFVSIRNEYKMLYTYLKQKKMHLASITKSYGIKNPALIANGGN